MGIPQTSGVAQMVQETETSSQNPDISARKLPGNGRVEFSPTLEIPIGALQS